MCSTTVGRHRRAPPRRGTHESPSPACAPRWWPGSRRPRSDRSASDDLRIPRRRCAPASPRPVGDVRPRSPRIHHAGRGRGRDQRRGLADDGPDRLGGIDRVTAERHGAIRVGSPAELRQVGRIFRGFGMHPVGFYDLRDARQRPGARGVDGISPDRRRRAGAQPVSGVHLDADVDDDRVLRRRSRRTGSRRSSARARCSRRAAGPGRPVRGPTAGWPGPTPTGSCELATAAFELSHRTDRPRLVRPAGARSPPSPPTSAASPRTHINHLTPRVLDIDELYARMSARGIAMIDEIQGPPRLEGTRRPAAADVVPRARRAADVPRARRHRRPAASTRVRFGEVEQRGIALTAAGRDRYDELIAEVDAALADAAGRPAGRRRRRRVARAPSPHARPGSRCGPRLLPLPRRRGRRSARRTAASTSPTLLAAGVVADADRLRGLPPPLGRRHLPVQPHRRGLARRRPARHRRTTSIG